MPLFCPLQNVTLLVVEEFALRTGVHMPWPQLERLADEIARSITRKVRHTHERFLAPRCGRRTRSADDAMDEALARLEEVLAGPARTSMFDEVTEEDREVRASDPSEA